MDRQRPFQPQPPERKGAGHRRCTQRRQHRYPPIRRVFGKRIARIVHQHAHIGIPEQSRTGVAQPRVLLHVPGHPVEGKPVRIQRPPRRYQTQQHFFCVLRRSPAAPLIPTNTAQPPEPQPPPAQSP